MPQTTFIEDEARGGDGQLSLFAWEICMPYLDDVSERSSFHLSKRLARAHRRLARHAVPPVIGIGRSNRDF
eukprot:scaffold48223_cov31-Tisochrysis_lutea.AAC.4